jgi:hypothetical protein
METQCSIFKLTSYLVLGTLGISHLPLKLKLQSHLESVGCCTWLGLLIFSTHHRECTFIIISRFMLDDSFLILDLYLIVNHCFVILGSYLHAVFIFFFLLIVCFCFHFGLCLLVLTFALYFVFMGSCP